MPDTRHIIECDACQGEATKCLCQEHYDRAIEEAIEDGKITGRDEAEEEAKKDDSIIGE